MICISISEKSKDKCLEIIRSAEMAEIRIDMAGYDETDVRYVFSNSGKPLIATCRPEIVKDSERKILLKAAIETGAEYVDIETDAENNLKHEIIGFARSQGCKVIVSYHNFKNTPDPGELHSIIRSCYDSGADIAKIATTALNTRDCARILSLYGYYDSLVALAMGEAGKITRAANIFMGSPFTFAAISDEQKTAPGQFTVCELNQIKSIIKKD
ncbi:MAG TPA: type I 3-dehydroquinate dehydratase [Ignavibacteria bacterium]|nr:type I 3-dehydroquinate dehydratase [Ignavibacteria bacterium]HMR39138.1 type I 3-dehydroquinate dehydratase [Ignavibacteria bacterium]